MSVQKILVTVLIIIVVCLVAGGIYFYYNVYKPINKPNEAASRDIVAEINTQNEAEEAKAQNDGALVDTDVAGIGPLTLPNNFNISIFAQDLGKPRVLRFDPKGNLLASLIDSGRVVAINDVNNDGKGEVKTLIIDLKLPHGIALKCDGKLISKAPGSCDLYIAETDKVSLYTYDPESVNAVFVKKLFALPADGYNNHFSRTIEIFNYKGEPKLFTSIGSSCNVCNEKDSKRASVLISNLDGTNLHVFSSGLRNSVFLEQKPGTEEVWATEMGRDQLGDDIPPDEINVLEEGKFYGWPNCFDDKVQDLAFDASVQAKEKCANSTVPKVKLQAHSAPLGLDFAPEDWPIQYANSILVAVHGSWNRSIPTGYEIMRIVLDENGNYKSTEDFITGWLETNGEVLGRPVDVESNGSDVYISDDKAGVIYKVSPK
jgi:glucose/arabinose dehydrogenase